MDSLRRFAEVLKVTATVFDYEIKRGMAEIYFEDLKGFDHSEIEQAFTRHRQTSKWFPRISDIIALLTPNDVTVEQEAIAQWDSVVALLSNSAVARADNPITEGVVRDLGGWKTLGQTDIGKLVWVQKEFVKRFVMHVETETVPLQRIGGGGVRQIGEIL